MNRREQIEDFLAQRELALVGVSRKGKKFGNAVLKELTAKGRRVFPVHPQAETVDGQPCWPGLMALPAKVGGVVVVVPPSETEKVVRDISRAGIPRVWMQQGSASDAAIRYCRDNGISVIHGECILMFAEPVGSIHRVHRWIWKIFGKLPQ